MKNLFTIQNQSNINVRLSYPHLVRLFDIDTINNVYDYYIKYQESDVTYKKFLDDIATIVAGLYHDHAIYEEKNNYKRCMKEDTYIRKNIYKEIEESFKK